MKILASVRHWFLPAVQRHDEAHKAGQRFGHLIVAAERHNPLAHLALVMDLKKQHDKPRSARAEAEWQAFHSGVHHVLRGPQQLDLFRSNP